MPTESKEPMDLFDGMTAMEQSARDIETQNEFDEANLLRFIPTLFLTFIGCLTMLTVVDWIQDKWRKR
jgi:hypothetical protein